MSNYTEARERTKACTMEHADQFSMHQWFADGGEKLEYESHMCGTSACIGGNAVLSSPDWKIVFDCNGDPRARHKDGRVEVISVAAQEIIGMSADHLFFLDTWPAFIAEEYYAHPSQSAEIACKAIDYFAELEDNA